MNHKLVIRNDQIKNRAAVIIGSLPLEPVHEVIIKPHKVSRSLAQNAWYWQALTLIAAAVGSTKEELHEECKRRFLVPIFERDDAEFADMVQSIRKVEAQGMKSEAAHLAKQVVRLVSTTAANVSQMAEYLTDIGSLAADLGVRLPIQDDNYV